MSIQFGRWSLDGQQPSAQYLESVSARLAQSGLDGNEEYSKGGLKILYLAFYTTEESRREKQPHIFPSGTVLTWDGRLDNRIELVKELRGSVTADATDLAIAAAAYETWGSASFGKLIGDWAMSIWDPRGPSLTLATDAIGMRRLYYSFERNHVTWSSILDPLVEFADRAFKICEEYVAGWFAYFPDAHLTPYQGVYAVPPASFVVLKPGKNALDQTVTRYWEFDSRKRIRYRTDAEYEEHFRTVFAQAVGRRLRSDRPVLAELSGGMDSASIVSMADVVLARGQAQCPRLDTISWFDDSYDHIEPDTNELHWVIEVEEKRHRPGHHISLSKLNQSRTGSHASFLSEFESEFLEERFALTPSPNLRRAELMKSYSEYRASQGYRVTVSGIGGSEFLGDGVPTPKQELQDLLTRGHIFAFLRQLKAWSARMRKSRLPVLREAMRDFFLPFPICGEVEEMRPPFWFDRSFVRRNQDAFRGYLSRVRFLGPRPSFQHNLSTFKFMQRLLADNIGDPSQDARYPCLDRDLLEFIFAIPREEIVRMGQRRSLMKRALAG